MLKLNRYVGETIRIGDDIQITIVSAQGLQAQLGILAPPDVSVDRLEVRERKDAGVPPPSGRSRQRPPLKLNSEFPFSSLYIDGAALASPELLHKELAIKLGFPDFYGHNWDALLDCLSSIDNVEGCLCSKWKPRTGKNLVLEVFHYSHETTDPDTLVALHQVIADANTRLRENEFHTRIWLELTG